MDYRAEEPLSLIELERRVRTLIEWEALEVILRGEEALIPYMMNDAAECYLVLSGVSLQGELPGEGKTAEVRGLSDGEKKGLFLTDAEGKGAALWFQGALLKTELYQYHRILHWWVKGEENLRRFVYILGTIYDKGRYLGEEYLSKEEKELSLLMECPLLRFFLPASPEYCGTYPDTREGFSALAALAGEAGEEELCREVLSIGRRRFSFLSRFPLPGRVRAEERAREELRWSWRFSHLLEQRIREASSVYPPRRYSPALEKEMGEERKRVSALLAGEGFEGYYPDFHRGSCLLTVYEEHPFAAEGMEEFSFSAVGLVENREGEKADWSVREFGTKVL